ncbi:MAG: hypothetical protein GEU93_08275 [Propionibacteriales bacterium]|nr:hypothetical protein [Propionibacteriales bacterium]
MQVELRRPYKYESLQVLLTVVLGFVHVAFYVFKFYLIVAVAPVLTFLGSAIGALEITVSRSMSARSALAVIRVWLLAVGICTIAFSASCLAYVIIAAHYN